jgi:hypothetical protein
MIYAAIFFRHYLLGNNFMFYVNHQTLLYLVNKLVVTSRIAKWLLFLQEFDFKVVYKPGQIYFVPDHLSQIGHGKLARGVEDQLLGLQICSWNTCCRNPSCRGRRSVLGNTFCTKVT